MRFALGVGSCWPILASGGSVRWSAAAVLLASAMKHVVDIMFDMNSTAWKMDVVLRDVSMDGTFAVSTDGDIAAAC